MIALGSHARAPRVKVWTRDTWFRADLERTDTGLLVSPSRGGTVSTWYADLTHTVNKLPGAILRANAGDTLVLCGESEWEFQRAKVIAVRPTGYAESFVVELVPDGKWQIAETTRAVWCERWKGRRT